MMSENTSSTFLCNKILFSELSSVHPRQSTHAAPKGAPQKTTGFVYEGPIGFDDVAMKLSASQALSLFRVHLCNQIRRQDTFQATSSGGQDTW